jgi:hypothetical protein
LSIESYSRAMELDPLSAVMPANRAMAHLKLKRSELHVVHIMVLLPRLSRLVYSSRGWGPALGGWGDGDGKGNFDYPNPFDQLQKFIDV